MPYVFAAWLCLPPVCPSKASVNPGRLPSQTWKRPLNGCLPLSANTLAEAEGGSGAGAGAALRHGFSTGAGSESPLPALLCDVVVMACTHTADRPEEGGLEKREFFSPDQRECVCAVLPCAGFSSAQESVAERTLDRAPHVWLFAFVVTSFIHPFHSSDPPVPSAIVNSFNLVI